MSEDKKRYYENPGRMCGAKVKITGANCTIIGNHWLTIRQVLKIFSITTQTLWIWRKEEKLPFIEIPGGIRPVIRFDPEHLRLWAKQNEKEIICPELLETESEKSKNETK